MNPMYVYGASTAAAKRDQANVQLVRAWDVVAVGPLMIWGGLKLRDEHGVAGTALAVFGVGTILYNALNFTKNA